MLQLVGSPVFWKDVLVEAERTGDVPRVAGIDVSKAAYPHSVIDFPLWLGPGGVFIFASAGGVPGAFAHFYADAVQSFFLALEYKDTEIVITRAGNEKVGAPSKD